MKINAPGIKTYADLRREYNENHKEDGAVGPPPSNSESDGTPQDLPIIDKLRGSVLAGQTLQDVQLPPRQRVIDDWFLEGDCGFIFAPRGLGKTWVSLGVGVAITTAGLFGPFRSKVSWPVLYADGEMPFEAIRARIIGLYGECPSNLHVLNHEVLFQNHEASLNLAQVEAQEALTTLCLELGIRVVILDNLSCLFSGLRENDADDWQIVKGWLLKLRRHRIAVIVVHHTGRNSSYMRGTSAREDDVFWVMRLDEPSEAKVGSLNGANFISRFTKVRNAPSEPPWYQWKIEQTAEGRVTVTTKLADGDDMIVQWVLDGLTSASDIALEMGVSKGTISKRATRLIKEGRLKKDGRGYGPGPLEESQW
jgi:AAA domain